MFRNKKHYAALLSFCFLVWLTTTHGLGLTLVEQAQAAGNIDFKTSYSGIYDVVSFLIAVIAYFNHVLLFLLEMLLDPAFVTALAEGGGGAGGIMGPLNSIWVISRDIVNIILAFLLVIGAVVAVVTAKKDLVMPYVQKFILAIILVNFSWFFPRVILDTANVLTATVYALPAAVIQANPALACTDSEGQPCQVWQNVVFNPDESIEKLEALSGDRFYCSAGNAVCYQLAPLQPSANTPGAIITGLTINHGRLFHLGRIPGPAGGDPSTNPSFEMVKLLINSVFALAITLMLFVIFCMLAAAFTVRIIILWVTMAFMPFMFLGYVLGDKMKNFNSMKIFNKFMAAAFLPAVTGIPLAAGFIILNASAPLFRNGGGLGAAWAKYTVTNGFLLTAVPSFLQLLWLIMTYAVFWVGVNMALKIDSIYEKAASYGKMAAMIPLSLPILPNPANLKGMGFMKPILGGGKAISAAGVAHGLGSFNPDATTRAMGMAGSLLDLSGSGAGGGGGRATGTGTASDGERAYNGLDRAKQGSYKSTFQTNIDVVNNADVTAPLSVALRTKLEQMRTQANELGVKFDGPTMQDLSSRLRLGITKSAADLQALIDKL